MKKLNVTEIVLEFRNIILRSWESALKLEDYYFTEGFTNAFLEALWEIALETGNFDSAVVFPYGEGSELYYPNGRVTQGTEEITHKVICWPKNNTSAVEISFPSGPKEEKRKAFFFKKTDTILFHEFGASTPIQLFLKKPPFHYFSCTINGIQRIFQVDDFEFYLTKWCDNE